VRPNERRSELARKPTLTATTKSGRCGRTSGAASSLASRPSPSTTKSRRVRPNERRSELAR